MTPIKYGKWFPAFDMLKYNQGPHSYAMGRGSTSSTTCLWGSGAILSLIETSMMQYYHPLLAITPMPPIVYTGNYSCPKAVNEVRMRQEGHLH